MSIDLRAARPWLVGLAAWLALATITAAQNYTFFAIEGRPITAWESIVRELRMFGAWAVITPAIVAVTRAVRRRGGGAWLLAHVPAVAAASLAHTTLLVAIAFAQGDVREPDPSFARAVWTVIGRYFVLDVIVYAGVALAVEALGWARAYRRREAEAARLEAHLARARLDALRVQLQPHFLFNALHAVSSLVDTDPAGARRTIVRLSELLRATLEVEAGEIPLREELALLERYLDIVRVRFHDRLTVTVDVPAALGGVLVPPLLLQPLVENALHHGVATRAGAATIAIHAAREGDVLRVVVADDGVGPPAEAVERIGLGATRARLEALHGGRASLALRAREGGGAEAIARLPAREVA